MWGGADAVTATPGPVLCCLQFLFCLCVLLLLCDEFQRCQELSRRFESLLLVCISVFSLAGNLWLEEDELILCQRGRDTFVSLERE